nr:zinc finger MYND domain-containing protein 15 isoform X1 [Tanacetum cinerariifolium]
MNKSCPVVKAAASCGQTTMGNDRSLWQYEVDRVRDRMAKFVIQETFPFDHFGNRRMTDLIKEMLQPRYCHVSQATLRRDCIKLWAQAKNELILGFQNLETDVNLTCDVWTAPHGSPDSYLCVTTHWVNPKTWEMMKRMISFELFGYPHTEYLDPFFGNQHYSSAQALGGLSEPVQDDSPVKDISITNPYLFENKEASIKDKNGEGGPLGKLKVLIVDEDDDLILITSDEDLMVCGRVEARCSFLEKLGIHSIGIWMCECSCGDSTTSLDHSRSDKGWSLPSRLAPCRAITILRILQPLTIYQAIQLASAKQLIPETMDELCIHYL